MAATVLVKRDGARGIRDESSVTSVDVRGTRLGVSGTRIGLAATPVVVRGTSGDVGGTRGDTRGTSASLPVTSATVIGMQMAIVVTRNRVSETHGLHSGTQITVAERASVSRELRLRRRNARR